MLSAATLTQRRTRSAGRYWLRTVSAYVRYRHREMSEGTWMTEVTRRTGCGMLCNLNNVFANGANLGESPRQILASWSQVPIGQIHLGGHAEGAVRRRMAAPRRARRAGGSGGLGPLFGRDGNVRSEADAHRMGHRCPAAGGAARGSGTGQHCTRTACRCREPAMTLSGLQARFADALSPARTTTWSRFSTTPACPRPRSSTSTELQSSRA